MGMNLTASNTYQSFKYSYGQATLISIVLIELYGEKTN